MKIFFDTEFTGLHKNTTLISIGCVAEDGRRFYAEFTDYVECQCDDWIRKNVLQHMILSGNNDLTNSLMNVEHTTIVIGNREQVSEALREWIEKYRYMHVQFVSDVCHYDMVLLIDLLWESAIEMPHYITPFCRDIAQDMVNKLGYTEQAAFDIPREQFLIDRGIALPEGQKHNSLYDAEVIKTIYDCVNLPFD